jgi:hypothetical protein
LYNSLNYQLNKLSQDLREANISINHADDKKFERFMNAMVKSKEIAQNITWLRLEIGMKDDAKESTTNPIEQRANARGK